MTSPDATSTGKCPVMHSQPDSVISAEHNWWPNQLNVTPLNRHDGASTPHADDFDYAKAFATLDLAAVRADLAALMTDSQEWWPADYGHYGPFFVRMAWHSAGTYRTSDGRGGAGAGMLRFAPLNSWPDNGNLDKARRLLWPIKQKYGSALSWGDLMILAGNSAIESMGLPMFGFGGGRVDAYEPEAAYWGPETTWLGDERYSGDRELEQPLGAVQMGLIYVNPQGPNGVPDPVASARDIRETFARMAMNDEETVALVAGGHTFGKAHGAANPDIYVGPEPEGADLALMGTGWANSFGTGKGGDTITSGIEGAWTMDPIKWDNNYFENLFGFEWVQTTSPAGAIQWIPADGAASDSVPDAHDPAKRHAPMMTTADMALRFDPAYEAISRRFMANPDQLADAFARAWFKLTHRDMGPVSRYLGPLVPSETLIWQDPVPAVSHALVGDADVAELTKAVLASGLSTAQLVGTAWASASTFRGTDKRGGANGARVALAPQSGWAANNPTELASVLTALTGIQSTFNAAHAGGAQISLADLIVLAGNAAVAQAASAGGQTVALPLNAGRTDATQEHTDVESFAVLEPVADGFRNYARSGIKHPLEALMVEQANLLTLTAAEMTALVGGLRSMGVGGGLGGSASLSNQFFVTLLDHGITWKRSATDENQFVGTGKGGSYSATSVDLAFGSNSQLRAIAEVYASSDGNARLVADFAKAWTKVMNLDRFDLR